MLALESIMEPSSLYDPVYSDGRDTIFVMDQIKDRSTDSDWLEEIALRQAMGELSEREKKILSLAVLFRQNPDRGFPAGWHFSGPDIPHRKRRTGTDQKADLTWDGPPRRIG